MANSNEQIIMWQLTRDAQEEYLTQFHKVDATYQHPYQVTRMQQPYLESTNIQTIKPDNLTASDSAANFGFHKFRTSHIS